MTARDDLLYEMTHNHLYMDDDQANAKIDAFAHELAEQIREMSGPRTPYPGEGEVHPLVIGMNSAADLIDPEVDSD